MKRLFSFFFFENVIPVPPVKSRIPEQSSVIDFQKYSAGALIFRRIGKKDKNNAD